MSAKELTQDEADFLLKISKSRIDSTNYIFPNPGEILQIHLKSMDTNYKFLLDIRRARIELKKGTYQLRIATFTILARIDLLGSLHRNPNGKEIYCPHIHLYREGYNDQWAFPLPKCFSNPSDLWQTLDNFWNFAIL